MSKSTVRAVGGASFCEVNHPPKLEELEPRLLLSADPVALFAVGAFSSHQPVTSILLDDNLDPVTQAPGPVQAEGERLELVFVDTNAPDYQQLVADLLVERNDGRSIQLFVLDNDRDGIEQITSILQSYQGVDAIHLISHGADSAIDLGSARLTDDNLTHYQQALQGWSTHLDTDADILIYGCNLAASASGQNLIEQIAAFTGADVAASDDLSGHASLGGDWDLEYSAGAIEATVAISADAQQAYRAVLETNIAPVLSGANDLDPIFEDDFSNAGTLVSELIAGQISDDNVLTPLEGIAVTAVDNSNGSWEYTVDGGSTWLAFGAPSESAARLLTDDADTAVRFVPNADWNGTVSDGLTFHAWDQTGGTAGGTVDLIATHTYTDQFTTAVFSNNDGSHTWSTDWIETDSGGATSGDINITGGRLAVFTNSTSDNIYREVDLTGATGATLTLDFDNRIDTSDKNDRVRLQISGDGGVTYTNLADFDYNTNTSNFGNLSFDITAYISNDTRVRFAVTNIDEPHYVYFDNVEITATGYPSTGGATAFSTATASSSLIVTAVNDEQTLTTNTGMSLLLGSSSVITQAMLETTDVDNTNAQLVYTLDIAPPNGTVLLSGTPLVATGTFTQADVDAGLVSYQHDGSATSSDSFDFSVDDGQGSVSSATFGVTITENNIAPVLSGANDLDPIFEDDFSNAGTLVSELIAGQISDDNVLTPLEGIAVTAVDNSNGSWEYTVDGGSTWLAFGAPSESAARLLTDDADTAVRFVPNADWNGTVSDGLTFHAWDQTGGTAGGTVDLIATHTYTDQFTTAVFSNNDGSHTWSTDWIETDSGGATSGDINITGGRLAVFTNSTSDNIYREVDLTGATGATLTLDFDNRIDTSDKNDRVRLQISGDGGVTYTNLADFDYNTNTSNFGNLSFDITAYISNDTRVRFAVTNIDEPHYVYFDNVEITATGYPSTGGATAFSTATASSSLIVTAVNDEQTLTTNTGMSLLLGSSSVITQAMLETTDVDNTNAQLVYTLDIAPPNGTVLLSGTPLVATGTFTQADVDAGLVSYQHDGSATSSDSFDFSVDDGQGSVSSATFGVTITENNIAPVLSGANDLDPIFEDDFSNAGTLVSELIAGQISDDNVLTPLEGIAVTAVDNSNGSWEYTVDGGSTWLAFGAPSESAARLLTDDADTAVRFVPNADWNGTVSDGLTFHAWDQTGGTAGGTVDLIATHTYTDQFTTAVFSNNDGSHAWSTDWIETDSGGATSGDINITGGRLAVFTNSTSDNIYREVDLTGATGATLTLDFDNRIDTSDKNDRVRLQISGDGGATYTNLADFDYNTNTSNFGNLSFDITAYISNDTRVRFAVTNIDEPHYVYFDNVEITATGYPSTGGATAFSTATASSSLIVTAVNDEQTLTTNTGMSLLLGSSSVITQAMLETTDVDNTNAQLVYTLDIAPPNGTVLLSGTPLVATGTFTQADVDAGLVSYQHDGSATSSDSFDFSVDDGQGSVSSATFGVTITENNIAPVLSGANDLDPIFEDDFSNAGTLVSELIAGQISDDNVLTPLEGIAVTAVDNSNGSWEYTVDGGSTWLAFGAPSESAARLLTDDADTAVRFVPNADWNGTVSDGLTFHAWDQTGGTAGGTVDLIATHTYTDQFTTAVFSNNDGSHTWSTDWIETDSGGATSGDINITGGRLAVFTNSTSDNIYREVDLTGATGATLTLDFDNRIDTSDKNDRVRLQISGDGGVTYTNLADFDYNTNTSNFGNLSFDITAYISNDTRVRFAVTNIDEPHYVYFDNVEITATGYPSTGGATAFSTATASSSLIVVVNNPPVLAGANDLTGINENPVTNNGTAVSALISGQVTDPDTAPLSGIAVVAVNDSDGTWQYTIDSGTTWLDFGTVTTATARLLADDASTFVRFVPDANWNGTVTGGLTFHAWDQTSGTVGGTANAASGSAFSSATANSTIAVNNVPVITASGGNTAFSEQATALAIDSAISLVDADGTSGIDPSTTYTATIQVTGNYTAADVLGFSDTLNIQGSLVGDTLTLSVIDDQWASIADFEAALQSVTFYNGSETPSELDRTISFTFYDGLANSNSTTKVITVTPVNNGPSITSTAGTTATEDTLYTYTASVTDPDDANNGTDLTWSLSGEPAGMVVSSTGEVTWTPTEGVTTSGAVTLTVSDGNEDGAVAATEVFTITVTPVNNGPSITSTAGTTATEDTLYTYTASVTDPDDANNGTDLTWSLSGEPAGMVVSSTGEVTWTPTEGVTTSGAVTLTVSDGNEDGAVAATEVFTITVTPVNNGPSITSTAGTTATEDTLYTYTASVTDPDDANNGTDLTWSLSGEPAGMVVSSTGEVTWTPTEGVTTSGAVTLTVSDGNEDGAVAATEVFTITVTPVNDAPTGSVTIDNMSPAQGALLTASDSLADDDGMGPITYQWYRGLNPVSVASGATYTTVVADVGETLRVEASYTDGGGTNETVSSASTAPVSNTNDSPTGSVTISGTPTEDQTLTAANTLADTDGMGPITYQWFRGATAVGTGTSYTLGQADVGATISVTASYTDGGGFAESVSSAPAGPIANVNDAPTITSTAGTTATEDTLYTYTASVTDPDDANNGTDLTWSLSGEPAGMVVSATGEVTWTPTEGVMTSGAVTLTVSDGNEDGAVAATEVFTITVTPVNNGPSITSTAGTTATEDTLYTYTASVTDPDDANNGTDLTWSLSGEPAGMVVSSTGEVTWTPTEGVTTSGAVTLTVSDGNEDGAVAATEVFTITVTPVNNGPSITSTAGTTATEDTLYTYTASVTDPDDANNGTDLTWSLSGEPAGMVVSSTGEVTWTPTEGVTTSGAVTLTVSDGNEDGAVAATEVFTITVTPVNNGPSITSTAGTTATEDTLYTYTASVTDPDDANNGTDLTWSLSGEPAGMVVSSTGEVTWTPTEGVTTSGAVTLTVSDGNEDGAVAATEVFTITVTPVNNGPSITSTAGTTATEDTLYTYTASVTDPDDANNGTDLTWSLSGEPAGMVVSSTGEVTWTPTEGVTTSGAVTLTVSDGNEDGAVAATEVFTITVTPVNNGPSITSTAGTTATEDTLYTYTASVTDPDDANNGTDLTWSLSGEPAGMVVSSTGEVTWTPTEGVTTSGAVTLTVSDGNEDGAVAATEVFTITVTPVNNGPSITSTAGTTATEDTLYTYTASVTDPDDANNGTDLTWSLSGEPAGMVVSSTGEVTWTPTEGVTTSGAVTLTVSDGNEDGAVAATEVFTITVTPVNNGPSITSTAGTTATEDTLYTYTASVTDPDDANNGTDLTWSLSGEPAGMVVSSTGEVTWTPTEGVTTSGAVTLTVSDGNEDGAVAATEVFTITVTPVNNGPSITSTAGTTATEDTLYTYTASVTDPDDANNGTDLTWSLSGEPAGMVVSSTGEVTWTPTEGVTTSGAVTLTVSDGNEDGAVAATEVFTITVTPVNNGPSITSTAGTTATEDTLYTYTASVTDPDDANNGTDLTWSLSGEPAGMVVSSTGEVTWTPTEGVTTSGAVTLTVSDGNEDGAVAATEVFTITVTPVNDAPTGSVTIDNMSPAQGALLTASDSLADDDGMGPITYQWYRGLNPVSVASGATYTTVVADVGETLRVEASYTDGGGTNETVSSASTAPVSNTNDSPTGSVTISGTPTEDQTLTAANTLADTDGMGPITYQWFRGATAVGTGTSYTLGQADVGATISVTASYTDGGGFAESVSSAPAGPIANVNDAPTITSTAGTTATEDTLYTYTASVTDPDDANDGTDLTWSLSGEPAFFSNDQELLPIGDELQQGSGYLDLAELSSIVTVGWDGGAGGSGPSGEILTADESTELASQEVRVAGSTRGGRNIEAAIADSGIPANVLELIEASAGVGQTPANERAAQDARADIAGNEVITELDLAQLAGGAQTRVELAHVKAVLNNPAIWQEIETMKREMDTPDTPADVYVVEVVSTAGLGVLAVLAAYVLRGGALLATLMSAAPLWWGYDPLPVLSRQAKLLVKPELDSKSASGERKVDAMFE